jgi:hypothetical protein
MGIEIVVETEDGTEIASAEDPGNILHRVLPRHDDPTYQCLNRIDWYGDTIFNRYQIPVIKQELQRLSQNVRELDALTLIKRIRTLAEQSEAEPHLYLKFYGD